MERRARRKHSDEFKQSAVELVTKQGYSIRKAAGSLNLNLSMFREWVHRLAPDWSPGCDQADQPDQAESDDPKALRAQLRAAQKQVEELRLERDILKKAAAYFAKESL